MNGVDTAYAAGFVDSEVTRVKFGPVFDNKPGLNRFPRPIKAER